MTASAHDRATALELSLEETWVVHAALLARIEQAIENGTKPRRERLLLQLIEDGDLTFDDPELRLLRRTIAAYLADPAERDRKPAENVLRDIELALP
jgi:hypothetical protein